MRILFTFAGGFGHAAPLIPIALAAQDVGHEVAFTGRASLMPTLEAHGFTTFAASGSDADGPPQRTPLLAVSIEREERVLREVFAGGWAREWAARVLALSAEWDPDLVVRDETDFGSSVAAERLRLPCATVLVTAAGSFVRPDIVAEPLEALRAEYGLASDPRMEMLTRDLVLSPFPPSFRDPGAPLPDTAHSLRPVSADLDGGLPPGWLVALGDAPIVYATLGTVFNVESGDLFVRLLAGLRERPINVVLTVGREIDPGEFGPQPGNVRIEQFVAQSSVLAECSAVVCHGGSGSVAGALSHGLPMAVIPMGADQPHNAARCEALGVGRSLDVVSATPAEIGEAVTAVLTEPVYRRAAMRMRDEIERLPGPEHAVGLLERLAATARG